MKNFTPTLIKILIIILGFSSQTQLVAQTCSITGDIECCENEVITYMSSDSGYVYQWNAYNGIVSGIGSTVTVNWNSPGAGLLTLVVKDNLNQVICTSSLNVTIHENPKPSIYPSFSSSCSNDVSNEDPTGEKEHRGPCFSVCDSTWLVYSTENHLGSTFVWNVTGSATVIPSTSNQLQVMWLGSGTGLVEVTETDSNGCIGYNTICVDILPKPQAAILSIPAASGGIINACNMQDIQFINNSTAGLGSPLWSYTWVFGDGSIEILDTSFPNGNTTYSYNSPGTYNVMLIAENECHCKDTAYITVIVDNDPGPEISCIGTVCPGSTVTYFTDDICPSYDWSVTNGTIVGDSTSYEVTVMWGSSSPAYLTLATVGCSGLCSSPTSVEIPIIEPAADIQGPQEICLYECQTYSISCNIPVDSIVWHFPDGVNVQTDTINEHEVEVCFYDPSFTNGQIIVEYFHTTPGSLNELSCGGTAVLDINARPSLFLNYPTEICDLTTLTGSYTMSGTGNIQWDITDAIGSTTYLSTIQAANISFQPVWIYGPGIFKVTAEDLSNNYCNSPQSFILTVNELPAPPDSIFGPNPICPNVPYQYYAFSTAANYAVQWDFENGNPDQNVGQSASTVWGITGPYVISAFQINPVTGCQSDLYVDTISSMLPLSPALISGLDTVCANGQQNYSTISLGDDFIWTITPAIAGSVISGQHEENIVVEWNNYNGSATLTLERTICEQTTTTNYPIEVISPPIPVLTLPALACEGTSVSMSVSAAGASFSWDFGDGTTDTGDSVNHTYTSAGNFIVTVDATYTGFCTGTGIATSTIMINPSPDITISTPDPNIFCGAVSPVNMYVSSPVTGVSYDWYESTSLVDTGTSHTSSIIGSYYVIGENSFGCIDTSNVIPIDTTCSPPCTPQDGSFVDFTRTRLDCNVDSFAGSFSSWATNPVYTFDDPFSGINSAAGANATHTFTEPGFYKVKLCVNVPNISNTDSCLICVSHVDTINYIPDFIDSTFCVDGLDSVKVKFINNTKVLSTAPTPTYEWEINSGGVVSTDVNPELTFAPGTYLITLIVNGDCEISKTIIIDPLPNADFLSEDSVCVDAPIQFISSSSGSIIASEWSFGDGAGSLITDPIKTYTPDNDYLVSLILTNAYGCTDSSSKSITVLPNTLDVSIAALSDTIFCEGDSVTLQSSVSNGYPAYNYLWSTIETDPYIIAQYTGQYYVEIDDSKGCYARSNKINVFANPTPLPKITGKKIVCQYEQEKYSVNYPEGLYSIEWILNGTLQWSTQSNYSFFANTLGSNTLIVNVFSPDSCMGSDTIKIEVVGNPNVSVISSGVLCEGETHLLVGTSTNTNIVSSFWNNGTTNDSLYASISGAYTFTVVDSLGCSSTATEAIHPLPEFCGLLTGCYDICDTIPELVWHAPQGYAVYQWLYNGSNISGSISDTLHVPLYQSGEYQVAITSSMGCTDTSDIIEIQFISCDCDFTVTDSIQCGPVNENGDQTYSVQFEINNTYGAGSIVNISSLQGMVTGITPSVIPLGTSTVSATFTDIAPMDTSVCFVVTLTYQNERCGVEVCSLLPDCTSLCEFGVFGLCTHCLRETDTEWTYSIELTVQNPFAANAAISVLPIAEGTFGTITPNPVPPGLSTVTIPFTDTNPSDSIICFKILLEHNGRICSQDVCAFLPDCLFTGIASDLELRNFSAFPNPASDNVTIFYNTPDVSESIITINDIRGRVVYVQQVNNTENKLDINVNHLSPGVYFVGLKNNKYSGSLQVIITGK
ncbi:MAG: PKD domain-containing protein [Bacteroidales bacterium]|nr:PKD domain-containing protein [Bacteroidales bacterium]